MAVMPALPAASSLPADLVSDIERAGYYPTLVADVVAHALAGEAPRAYLVHQETTFDEDTVRRHITVLAVTSSGWSSPTPTTTPTRRRLDRSPRPTARRSPSRQCAA